jgi:actin-like ATPase involved in cell morphogenesis
MPSAFPFIGIDFGTSKSVMAAYNPQDAVRAEAILSNGRDEVPSIVYIGPNRSDIRVGQPAAILLDGIVNNLRVGRGIPDLRRFYINIKRNLVTEPDRYLDGEAYTPVYVVSKILGKLKYDAERGYFIPIRGPQRAISRVVITHPAAFGDVEIQKIREAAQLAGFEPPVFLPEPEAAAIAYAHSGTQIGQCILVYDFGAGTFDVAAMRREAEETFRLVVPPRGSDRLGGDRLDPMLYDHLDSIAQKEKGVSFNKDGRINLALLRLCRSFKENLSIQPDPQTFEVYIQTGNGPVQFEHTITQAEFEELIRPMIQETVNLTREVMEEASRAGHRIDTVVLVGGSSQLPLVEKMLQEGLQVDLRTWAKQHIAVALGAALYARQQWEAIFTEYRLAVSNAWTPARLITPPQAAALKTLAANHGLTDDEAAMLEYIAMGMTKEEDLARQYRERCDRYREEVMRVQQSNTFTRGQLGALMAKEKELDILKQNVETIERDLLNDTKERAWEQRHQFAVTQYRGLVTDLKRYQFPEKEQIQALESKARDLDLLAEEEGGIEREVLGDTKENYYARRYQETLTQYRDLVIAVWEGRELTQQQTRVLTQEQVSGLAARVEGFHLSNEEAAKIETEVMGYPKEMILKLQVYRDAVMSAWQNEVLTEAQITALTRIINELGIHKEDASKIEIEVMRYTKEMILKRKRYWDEVKKAWQTGVLNQPRYNTLIAKRKELGISDKDAESIEREEMGDTVLNIYNRQHQEALKRYRESVQAAKAQVDALSQQEAKQYLSQEEITTIHREEMPSLLPSAPVRSDRIAALFCAVVCVVLAGGFIGYAWGYNAGFNYGSSTTPIVLAVIFGIAAVLSLVWLFYQAKPRTPSASSSSIT